MHVDVGSSLQTQQLLDPPSLFPPVCSLQLLRSVTNAFPIHPYERLIFFTSPDLAAFTGTISVVSPTLASTPASPHKSNGVTIAGGVIGGIAFILLAVAVLFAFLRKRRNLYSDATIEYLPLEARPESVVSQLGPAHLSTPVLPDDGALPIIHQ